MFAYNPTVNDTSGQILAQGQISSANTTAQANIKFGDDIGGALVGLASAYANASGKKKEQKELFDGAYNFLSEKNLMSPSAKAAIDGFSQKKDYAAANAYIAPYLAELDFGRKSMLAGRSGFFDAKGNWQMALRPEPVNPPNKEGYVYRGGQ
jgi:hypothetical protein